MQCQVMTRGDYLQPLDAINVRPDVPLLGVALANSTRISLCAMQVISIDASGLLPYTFTSLLTVSLLVLTIARSIIMCGQIRW